MTPDQIADLALRAGRDMRRVERVRALLDGREWVPAGEIRSALEAGHQDHVDAKMESGPEVRQHPEAQPIRSDRKDHL